MEAATRRLAPQWTGQPDSGQVDLRLWVFFAYAALAYWYDAMLSVHVASQFLNYLNSK